MEKPLGIVLIVVYLAIYSISIIISAVILLGLSSLSSLIFILSGILILLATLYLSSCYGLWSITTWALNVTRFTLIFDILLTISYYIFIFSYSSPLLSPFLQFKPIYLIFPLINIVIFIYVSTENITQLYQGNKLIAAHQLEISSPQKMMLYGLAGHLTDCAIELHPGSLIMGRDPRESNIIIPDNNISKRHIALKTDFHTGQVRLEDLGSRNGTYMASGQKINPGNPQHLRPGDRFFLADKKNIFEIRLKE